MSMHVITGSGPVGSAVAVRLARQGEQVRVITRSGTGPAADGIETIAADATDTGRLTALTKGAATLYNVDCAAYQDTFGAAPTPMGQALTATLTWWHDQGRAAARKE